MPVYDYSYKIWEGRRRSALWRWMAIPKYAYMEVMKLRLFTSMLTIASLHFVIRMTFIYLYVNVAFLKVFQIPQNILPPIDAVFFKNTIDLEFPICFMLAFSLGAGLISRDLKHGALVLYVSKPIDRWEYFLGKFSVLFFVFMALLWAMPSALYILQVAVAADNSPWHLYFLRDYAWIFGAIALYAFVVSTTLSLLIMTASSLTKNARYAGISFVVFLIGTNIMAPILAQALGNYNWLAFSPSTCAIILGNYIFRQTSMTLPEPVSQFWAWAGILIYWAVCGLILRRQINRGAQYGR